MQGLGVQTACPVAICRDGKATHLRDSFFSGEPGLLSINIPLSDDIQPGSQATMSDCLHTERLESVTVILPVMNETTSLNETVEIVLADAKERVKELLIVVCNKTTSQAMATVAQLEKRLPGLVVVHQQRLPFLGGAVREAFDLARGSHVILMASDLETDPHDVKALIGEAEKNPSSIVTATRWRGGMRFEGYSKVKLLCNWLFQKFFGMLYGSRLSDMTFGYRIFPTRLVQGIRWEELRHPLLFETLIKPLRLGVPVMEISSGWRARTEGESQNPFFRNFAYFRIGLRVRFAPPASVLKVSAQAPPAASPPLHSTADQAMKQ